LRALIDGMSKEADTLRAFGKNEPNWRGSCTS
jgi:hypothetical protein